MSRRPVLQLVIVLALVATGFVLFIPRLDDQIVDSGHESPATPAIDGPAAVESAVAVPSLESATVESGTTRRAASVRPTGADTDSELRDAIWVEGRVILPEGTPPGERVEIVARGKPFPTRAPYRAPPAADGSFRVAFAPGTTAGLLLLDARFLYLEQEPVVHMEKLPREVVLEPKLGAVICGRLILRSADPEMRRALDRALVRVSGNIEGKGFQTPGAVERSSKISSAYTFEFAGLPPALVYQLGLDLDDFGSQVRNGVTVAPGQVTDVELEVLAGATVRGRVVDERGMALPGVRVGCLSQLRTWVSKKGPSATSSSDGSFEIAGIYPGRVTLLADTEGTNNVWIDLGELGDNEIRSGVEVVLTRKLPITGLVQWPDGSPAAGCSVSHTFSVNLGKSRTFGERELVCGPDGKFQITDSGEGAIALTATLRPKFEGKPIVEEWVAHLEGVEPGTEGLVLILRPGAVIRGTVVDGDGKSPARGSVFATRVRSETLALGPARRGPGTAVVDGAFEITGLFDGDWDVVAEAPGYAKSETIRVSLPGHGAPIDLVLRRNATLSGVVVDGSERPVAGARFRVGVGQVESLAEKSTTDAFQLGERFMERSDSEGRFEIQGVPPGHIMLSGESEDRTLTGRIILDVEAGESRSELRLYLSPRR